VATKCTPCVGKDVKGLLRTLNDAELNKLLDTIADCPRPADLVLCGVKRSKGTRTEYQEFISTCIKSKAPNGMSFGEAPQYMKQCAAEWRQRKSDK